jgi:D-beta-D-heptose 7-phosphate kinase/D-beta-D-heptose 1-phosphate adenosyltransferase
MMGALGEDSHGARLKDLLRGEKIELDGVVELSGYQTIVKTRIIARHQQVVRVDREIVLEASDEVRQRCLKQLDHLLPELDAVILEDYGKGFLTQSLVDEIVAQVRRAGKIVTADPNTRNPLVWRGLTAIKPNRAEAFAAAEERYSEPGPDPLHDKALLRVGATLLKRWVPEQLLITLGEQGMLLLQPNAEAYHVPSRAREIYDVSGAGDTAIAFLSLALAAGANPVEAAEISNHASGVAVAKLGTATVSLEELQESFRATM